MYIIMSPCLYRFIQEIELSMGTGKQCQLHTFLAYYINELFLNQVRTETNKEIETVTKVADPLKILASADTMKTLGVQRPLLQVALQILNPSQCVGAAVVLYLCDEHTRLLCT